VTGSEPILFSASSRTASRTGVSHSTLSSFAALAAQDRAIVMARPPGFLFRRLKG
jgi:hypothetical protein